MLFSSAVSSSGRSRENPLGNQWLGAYRACLYEQLDLDNPLLRNFLKVRLANFMVSRDPWLCLARTLCPANLQYAILRNY